MLVAFQDLNLDLPIGKVPGKGAAIEEYLRRTMGKRIIFLDGAMGELNFMVVGVRGSEGWRDGVRE